MPNCNIFESNGMSNIGMSKKIKLIYRSLQKKLNLIYIIKQKAAEKQTFS